MKHYLGDGVTVDILPEGTMRFYAETTEGKQSLRLILERTATRELRELLCDDNE